MPARQVDDREPAKAKSEGSSDVVSLVIRTSMHKGLGHRLDVTAEDGLQTSKVKLSANTAHIVRFKSRLAQSFPLSELLRLLLKYESQSLKNKLCANKWVRNA